MEIPNNLLEDKKVFKEYFQNYFKKCFESFPKPISYKQLIEEQLKAKPIKDGINQWYNKRNKITRGLVKFSIKSNYTASMNIKDKKILKDDTRYELMMKYLNKTLEYCKKNKLPIPNTEFVLFIADRFPFELDDNNIKYPMFCYATTKNKHYPLLPDNTFLEFSFKKRFGSGEDWDTSKKTFKEKIYKKPKSNKLFFRGKDTTNFRTGLRRIIYEEQDKEKMKVELLEGDVKYIPMYKFSYYKYLLDINIRFNTKLREAARKGCPINIYAPNSIGYNDYKILSKEIMLLGKHREKHFKTSSKESKKVSFVYHRKEAKKVYLLGDFNNWEVSKKYEMKLDKDGKWKREISLEPGVYQYKYFVDGKWVEDKSNPISKISLSKGITSIIEI